YVFILQHPAPSESYSLSLHDALPICVCKFLPSAQWQLGRPQERFRSTKDPGSISRSCPRLRTSRPRKCRSGSESEDIAIEYHSGDRKSTRLNSSHEWISYAVFCLKKK